MILVIDIGNTNAVIGALTVTKKLFLSRIATDRSKMSDEYAITIKSILAFYGVEEKKSRLHLKSGFFVHSATRISTTVSFH